MQKLVKGATKPKAAAPKAKYVEPILSSTFEGGHDFEVVMDSLAKVIATRNGTWPQIYKALIMVHIMIREGSEDITLKYISRHPRMFDIEDHIHRAPAMGRYARYLATRGQQFKETKIDFVRYKTKQGHSRLHSLPVAKGLMRECGSVLIQLEALMKCQYQEQDIINDDLLLMAFRLLVHDALSLFQVLNEGVINLLEHFFVLSKPDAEQALDIYRGFRRLTSKVIGYLRIAKDLEFKTMLHVPNIKHAPTSLVSSLEMYVSDPAFESNRRQYLAERDAHEVKRTRSLQGSREPAQPQAARSVSAPQQPMQPQAVQGVPQQPMPPMQSIQPVQPVQQAQPMQQAPPVQPVQAVGAVQPSAPAQPMQADPTGNPFWTSQQESSQIQTADGQAQIQMQQLRQLQMEQLQQQQSLRQQLEQQQLLLQQNQQAQQQAQAQAQQAQAQAQQAQQAQQVQQAQQMPFLQSNPTGPYMESNHTGGFDFGLQPTMNTQQISQQEFQPPYQTPSFQSAPSFQSTPSFQQQSTPSFQQQYQQPQQPAPQLQPQSTDHNPFKQHNPASPLSHPFKSSPSQLASQFAALDNVAQMQPSLIDFGQPQATGSNPFRA